MDDARPVSDELVPFEQVGLNISTTCFHSALWFLFTAGRKSDSETYDDCGKLK